MNDSTAIATRQPSNFEITLEQYSPQFAAALPSHITVAKFKRTIVTALNQNPDLAKADRRSLFTACIQAAQDGLFPDGKESALVIFGGKVSYLPMVAGIRKRMRNTGEVAFADAQVVYEKDEFDYRLGDEATIHHKPVLGDRGKPIGAYAIIKLTNGEVLREVMSVSEIERARAVNKGKNPAWVNWWDQMARKVVLKRCAKAAPTSAGLDTMLERDEVQHDAVTLPTPIPERPRRRDFAQPIEPEEEAFAGDIANEVAAEMAHDPETGEIVETGSGLRPVRDDNFWAQEDLEVHAPLDGAPTQQWNDWQQRMLSLIAQARPNELEVLRSHNLIGRARCLATADPRIVAAIDAAFAAAEKRGG